MTLLVPTEEKLHLQNNYFEKRLSATAFSFSGAKTISVHPRQHKFPLFKLHCLRTSFNSRTLNRRRPSRLQSQAAIVKCCLDSSKAVPLDSVSSNSTNSPSPSLNTTTTTTTTGTSSPHRLSPFLRKTLTIFSGLGAIESAYLTFVKLFSSPGAICATQGCLDVLAGPYSSFLGIPLSAFGMVAYTAFSYLSAWPLFAREEEHFVDLDVGTTVLRTADEVYAIRDAVTRPLMLAISSAMFVFSSYLIWLLAFVIKSLCPYCIFSATDSLVLFILTAFVGRAVTGVKKALSITAGSVTFAILAAGASFFVATPHGLQAHIPTEPQSPPQITQRSNSDSMRIAKKLETQDTKMYGAYWCTHCYDQKQRFGIRAFKKIKYIECDRYGKDTQYKLCRQKRIPGYPTWEIGGKLYPGEILLEDLEKLAEEP